MDLTDEERYKIEQKTYDCVPTLTDDQVLEFCKQGFLLLEGVVPDEINRRTFEYLEKNTYYEPTEILRENWFFENVILNTQAAGAIRSLLGTNFGLPILMSQHRVECPNTAQGWHRDASSKFGPELTTAQVFYYPQNTPVELGPTEILPGSHLSYARQIGHYGSIRGAFKTTAPAGTIFITVYSIWHRRAASTAKGMRHMLKYNYWRTVSPERDWMREPDFDFDSANYGPNRLQSAQMFYWLCGKASQYHWVGGQAWPLRHSRGSNYKPYGSPSAPPRRG